MYSPATTTGSTLKPDAVHLMVSAARKLDVAACDALCLCMIYVPLLNVQALCEDAEGEDEPSASQGTRVRYGFAFLDAAAARFYVGSASDDGSRANLTALLTQVSMGRAC